MRKCLVTTNVQVIRTDKELLEMWSGYLKEGFLGTMNNIVNIDPMIASRERNSFYQSNASYCEKQDVLGLFHQWGNDYEEFENGPGNYVVGVIELADGSIITRPTNTIKFLPPNATGFEEFAKMGHQNLGRMMY